MTVELSEKTLQQIKLFLYYNNTLVNIFLLTDDGLVPNVFGDACFDENKPEDLDTLFYILVSNAKDREKEKMEDLIDEVKRCHPELEDKINDLL